MMTTMNTTDIVMSFESIEEKCTSAFSDFIAVLAEVVSHIEDLNDRIEDLNDRISCGGASIEKPADDVVKMLHERIDKQSQEIEALTNRCNSLEEKLEDFDYRLDEQESDVNHIEGRVDDLEDGHNDLDYRMDNLESDMEDLEPCDNSDEISAIHSEIDEIKYALNENDERRAQVANDLKARLYDLYLAISWTSNMDE